MSMPTQSLDEWLSAATEKLSAPAKERIKLEIEAHFQDAIEAYRTEGQGDSEARVHALADLGDAKAAAKKFRKRHLTETETTHLKKTLNYYRKYSSPAWLGLVYGCYGLFFILEFHLLKKNVPLILPAVLAVMVLAFTTVEFWIMRFGLTIVSPRRLLMIDILNWLSILSFGGLCGICADWGVFIAMIIGSSVKMVRSIPLWIKLSKIDDASQEIPPSGAAES
jgi:hypothetical protein